MIIYFTPKNEPDKKPWGKETTILKGVAFWDSKKCDGIFITPVVKHIVNKYDLSLQNHTKKFESWFFLKNPGYHWSCSDIELPGKSLQKVKQKELVHIPPGYIHSIAAGSEVIEVQDKIDGTNRIMDFSELRAVGREMHPRLALLAHNKFLENPKVCPYRIELVDKLHGDLKSQ